MVVKMVDDLVDLLVVLLDNLLGIPWKMVHLLVEWDLMKAYWKAY